MAPQWRPCPSPLRCCSGLLLVSPWLYFLASVSLQDRAQPASREEGGDGGGDRADTWARSRVAIIEDTSIAQLPQMTPVPIRGGATFTDAFALAQARQPQAPARPRQAPVPLSSAPDLAVGKDQTPKPPEPESGGSCPSLLVALAATSSQIEGAVVVIASALAHASAPESLKFRVITYAADAAALVGGLRARLGRKADLRAVAFDEWKPRVSELLGRQETFASRRELFDELNFAAFYLHELFPNTDRVLYLDTDTVVQTDLACELATGRLDLKGRPAAGAKDCSQNIGKYVNFEKMKKHDVASRLPLQLKVLRHQPRRGLGRYRRLVAEQHHESHRAPRGATPLARWAVLEVGCVATAFPVSRKRPLPGLGCRVERPWPRPRKHLTRRGGGAEEAEHVGPVLRWLPPEVQVPLLRWM